MLRTVRQDRWFLIILFFCSFVLRAGVLIWYLGEENRFWQVDSNTYHLIGTEIANGNGYSLPDGQPAFYRLPGYPFFLGACYTLFGHSQKRAMLVQTFVASFIPMLIFFLSLALFPTLHWLAKTAAIISSFHLGLVLYAGFFMSESLFLIFFLLFALFFIRSLSTAYESVSMRRRMQHLLLAGLFLGIASLIRPVGHYLIVVATMLLLFQSKPFCDRFYNICSLITGWLIPVSFLLLRNFLLTGYLFFHTLPGGHFLYLSAARVAMHPCQCSYQEARNILHNEAAANISREEKIKHRPLNEIERCKIHERLACFYFIHYPMLALRCWITDMFRTTCSLFSAELLYLDSGRKMVDYFAKDRSIWSIIQRYIVPATDTVPLKVIIWVEIIAHFLLLLGFLYGLIYILAWGDHSARQSWFMLIPFMALFIVISLAGGYARMRLPIEPFMIILSLYGWSQLFNRKNCSYHTCI